MGEAGRQRVALEPFAGIEQPRGLGLARGGASATRRCEPGERLAREVEPVGNEPKRLLALGRVLRLREHLARADEALLSVRRAIELEPDAVEEIALGAAETLLEPLGRVRRVLPRGSVTTLTSNPCAAASSIPRRVAS